MEIRNRYNAVPTVRQLLPVVEMKTFFEIETVHTVKQKLINGAPVQSVFTIAPSSDVDFSKMSKLEVVDYVNKNPDVAPAPVDKAQKVVE